MPLDIVVGAQWGDEGKGRMVDYFAAKADYVARFNGGDNAGHTVTVGKQTFRLHLVPSGVVHPHPIGVIGNGVVINPTVLLREIEQLKSAGISISPQRLIISHAAHIITPGHLALDRAQETARGNSQIGTTLRGIGPAYTSKSSRHGLRMSLMLDPQTCAEAVQAHIKEFNQTLQGLYATEPLEPELIARQFAEYAMQLKPYIADVSTTLTEALKHNKRVLAEGAQGTLLDLDHGTYPFVTSSTPTASGALVGLGLGLGYTGQVTGVVKAFQTRVGAGPFPTEVHDETAEHLRGTGEHPWDEFGTTTGRPRRVGWLDGVLLRYAVRVNGLTQIALTKLDILTGLNPIRICNAYQKGDQIYHDVPLGVDDLHSYQPKYEELHGWENDIRQVRHWEDLPLEARTYISYIEQICSVPVDIVSVGPEREQIIKMI